jgi:hypothetical protein
MTIFHVEYHSVPFVADGYNSEYQIYLLEQLQQLVW